MGRDIRTPQPLQMFYCIIYGVLCLISLISLMIATNSILCKINVFRIRNKRTTNNHIEQDKSDTSSDMNPFIKTATFICMIGYFVSLLVSFGITIVEVVYDPILTDSRRYYEQDFAIPGVTFYMLGRWTMLLLFIQLKDRLYI